MTAVRSFGDTVQNKKNKTDEESNHRAAKRKQSVCAWLLSSSFPWLKKSSNESSVKSPLPRLDFS